MTMRGWRGGTLVTPRFASNLPRVQEGLWLAGLRDHSDEKAGFRHAAGRRLAPEYHRPRRRSRPPGVTTIITAALAPMLIVQRHPVLLDTSDWVPRFQT
jgi:hypothetical protein